MILLILLVQASMVMAAAALSTTALVSGLKRRSKADPGEYFTFEAKNVWAGGGHSSGYWSLLRLPNIDLAEIESGVSTPSLRP